MISEMVALSQADTVYSVNQLFNLKPMRVIDIVEDNQPHDESEVQVENQD